MTGNDVDYREARVPSVATELGPTPDGSAFTTWKRNLEVLYDIRLPDTVRPEEFSVRGRAWQLPSATLTSVSRSGLELRRDADFIAKNPVDNICLYFAMAGTMAVYCDGHDFEVEKGDIFLMDFTRPVTTIARDRYGNATLMFTRTTGPALFRDGALHGAVLRAGEPGARLLHAQLQSLLSEIDELPLRTADAAAQALLSVAATMMEHGRVRESETGHRIVDRAVAAIRNQIGNAALKPEVIAAEIGVSRARLYRLLEPYGGVRNLVSRVRLDESLKTLADKPPEGVAIADIARRHGFGSTAQFNRAFRARFGRSPKDIVEMRKANPTAQLYRAWVEARRAQADFETIDAWLASVSK